MIKILVVEDNPSKASKILKIIKDIDIPDGNVYSESTIIGAKRKLKDSYFDLMILDLVLPIQKEEEASPKNGIDFLREIYSSPIITPPIHIVGLTEFSEYVEQYEDDFKMRLWHLINYRENEADWKDKLKQIIYHLMRVRKDYLSLSRAEYDFDIAILTALNEELEAILKLPGNWKVHLVENDATTYYVGSFQKDEEKKRIVCASAPQMGMVASATLAMKMISCFRPKYIVMAGIAAGYKSSGLNSGDILVVDQSYDGTAGKIITADNGKASFSPNPTPIPLDPDLKEIIRKYENNKVLFAEIKSGFSGNTPDTELKCKLGPVVSVPYVVSCEDAFLQFKDVQRKLIGLEMEAYGVFYSAMNSSKPKPKSIVIKSICDFGDQDKGDEFHKYATYTSARFVYELILRDL